MAESYRALRTSLLLSNIGAPPKVIMVTSALPQEGKTTTSINTAVVLAQKGVRVLLIDADLRRPSLHRLLNVPAGPGLSELLCGSATLADTLQATPADGLFVIAAGQAGEQARQWLALGRLSPILEALKEHFDFVLIDSAPVLPVTDTLMIGQEVDGVIFAVLREVSLLPKVYAAYQRLTSLGYACSVAIAMPQDAIEPIRRMCKWIVDEECDADRVIPLWKLGGEARGPDASLAQV